MAAILGPASRSASDLRIFRVAVGAVVQEEFNHRTVAVEGSVMQSGTGVVKSAGDDIDLSSFVEQQFRRIDLTVHAGVNKSIVDDALPILRP